MLDTVHYFSDSSDDAAEDADDAASEDEASGQNDEVVANHVLPHYFIERFVIFSPSPPFFDMQDEGISRQNQSILGRENAGGRIRRLMQGVEKSGESRFMMVVVLAIAR